MAALASAESLSAAERADMLRAIEKRKNDLLEKRKLLESLSKTEPKSPSATKSPALTASVEPSSLVKDVVTAMSAAQKSASEKPEVPAETGKASPADKKKTTGDTNSRYAFAVKKAFGSLSTKVGVVDIIVSPKVIDRFDKSCQCDALPPAPVQTSTPINSVPQPTSEVSRGSKVTAAEITKKHVAVVDAATPSHKQQQSVQVEKAAEPPAPFSEEEKKKLIYGSAFTQFFHKASRMVERALGESQLFDVFADYSQVKAGMEGTVAGERLRFLETYVDNRWSPNRTILDVRTHPKFNELFLVAYSLKADASTSDPDGCALIWNMAMPQRAEFVFTCQSQICTTLFDTYRPNIVLGGTFTGSLMLWDTRAKTRPVQRTPLSPKSHNHPVYSMQLVGTEHAHNLVTVDLDGRLCVWSLSMFVQPTETVELKKGGRDFCCMCIDFAEGENNSFVGGAEDGSLFQAQIHGSKAGIIELYSGHTAPVTALHYHPASIEDDFGTSDLLLSSSYDWSVMLWSPKGHGAPLQTFHASDDYAMDVEWHPNNPGIFASSYADGELCLWDISKDIEVPYVTQSLGQNAVSALSWSPDGCRIMTGDSAGVVKMWGVSNDISTARQEDRARFGTVIEELLASDRSQQPSNL